jgi:molecular chaperone DnaK
VNAKDKATGKEQSIRIEASSGLSDTEIDKMVNDAKKHESEDKEKREKIDLVNQAEHLIYETEKNIKEHEEKLDETEKDGLTEKVDSLKKAKDSGNIDEIKSSMDALNASWSAIASKMYDASKQEEGVPNTESTPNSNEQKKKEDEIEDADFEVVD